MGKDILDTLSELSVSLLTINDFKTLFLMLAAILIAKPLSIQTRSLLPDFLLGIRRKLRIEPDDHISDRSILSFLYCWASLFAWLLVKAIYPEFTTQQKLISVITWPFFSYVLISGILLVITPFYMLPYDLLVFAFFFYKKLRKK